MSNIELDTKKISEIRGNFYLPDYQRGYRWGKDEINLLLRDLQKNGNNPYCLQPIVVKKVGDRYELIDGQQRLTTIFLLYKYFESALTSRHYAPKFEIEYETRKKSAEFLQSLDLSRKDENIDFYHIANAFEHIRDFFEMKDGVRVEPEPEELTMITHYFKNNVTIIWYEVDTDEDGVELFERLNIGKIPLTSSELVKALFLKSDSEKKLGVEQDELALQWDSMEQALHEPAFWAFLTNSKGNQYPTRIDLILDLISGKKADEREKYFTFFHFDRLIERMCQNGTTDVLKTVWQNIYHTFLTLREWYLNHQFYHKIGYLISSNSATLSKIYKTWKADDTAEPLNKDDFERKLNKMIQESLDISDIDDLKTLSYSNTTDTAKIHRALLLFNVESERLMDEGKRRFPFDKHKEGNWSLEHIHAQHSEGLATNAKILTWLKDHEKVLKMHVELSDNELMTDLHTLIDGIESALAENRDPKNVRTRFAEIQQRVVSALTPESANAWEEYKDNITNLALIDGGQNAALSNYVFDAKRDIIIGYDKMGKYIPICTKMVFFKYYSSGDTNLHFWGESDRNAYLRHIDSIISPYYLPAATPNLFSES